MEYLVGAIVAIISLMTLSKIIKREGMDIRFRPKYSQSHIFELVKNSWMPMQGQDSPLDDLDTQATRHFDSNHMRVLFINSKAYWIKDRQVYVAEVVNGVVDDSSTKALDMMGLSKVELDEMVFIIDKLNEGSNSHDGGNSGNKKF